jgi:GT2 family glycosyltransferase
MATKVTTIVITYNAKEDLKECLESLEKQAYKEKELIVVNDASTDDTLNFLKQYKNQTSMEMKVISNERNLGVAGARNVGIKHAAGDIIAFMDSDCVADRNWVLELVKGFKQKDIAAVGGSISDGRISNIWELVRKGHDYVATSEGYVPFIKGCNMSFDTNVLKKYMFNDEIKYGYEDILLCDSLNDDGYRILYKPEAVVHHKHRSTLKRLLKQMYLRGYSSIWYLKKRKKFFMYKRHFLILCALIFILFSKMNQTFLYVFLFLFSVASFYLVLEEIKFNKKTVKEIILTFPFRVFIELFHFAGAMAGILKFRVLGSKS